MQQRENKYLCAYVSAGQYIRMGETHCTMENWRLSRNKGDRLEVCYALCHILVCALTCTYILIRFVALDRFFLFTRLISDYSEISILSSYVPFHIVYAYLPL